MLQKNRNSLKPRENIQLEEFLAANLGLFVVYVLREFWALRNLQIDLSGSIPLRSAVRY